MSLRFLFFVSLIFTGVSIAQEEWGRDAFIKEVKEDIKDNDYRDHRRAGKQFVAYFEDAVYSDFQEEFIYRLMRDLRGRRFNDAEDFYEFFRLLNHYGAGHLKDENLDAFLESSVNYISSFKHKTAKAYITSCSEFLVDSLVHSGKTFQWKIASGDFIFKNDSIPVITGSKLKLLCQSRLDTLTIYETQGHLDLLNHKWVGRGGQSNWMKHGIPEDSIWVKFKDYSIDLREPYLKVENVQLHGSLKHDQGNLMGVFTNKLSANSKSDGAFFPSFVSDNDSINFKNIFEDVDAEGRIELRGKRLFMFGKEGRNVRLTFHNHDAPFIHAFAKRYRMQDHRIFAENSKIKLYWNRDSIVHPQLNLNYSDSSKIISFERTKKEIGMSPIRSSYHKLDCYFDRMSWNKDSAALFFSNDRSPSQNPALLESFDYYKDSRYQDVATMSKRHPAFILKTMSRAFDDERFFWLFEIADYYNYGLDDAHQLMTNFAVLGFVDYDMERERIEIKNKLFHFLDAKLAYRDYDALRVVSRSNKRPYARMNLESGDLDVFGVNMVELSDSNDVSIFPFDGNLSVHQNRDFTFDGIIQTGHFGVYGKRMRFTYDSFHIELNAIDSLKYSIPSGIINKDGSEITDTVKTVISDITGFLFIDGPENKSGLADQSDFPKIHSVEHAQIYYDYIKGGVYERDLFSFQTAPFQLDSLLIIKTNDLEFPGTLNAPTIFPSFQDTMRLNQNLQLSFSHKIKDKYPAYEGRGEFTDDLYLDNKGLSGRGAIYYLNSLTVSDSVYFYPYHAIAHAKSHHIFEQSAPTECPEAYVEDANINWLAFENKMTSKNRELPYTVYREKYDFDGSMTLGTKALQAKGVLYYDNAITASDDFLLQSRDFTANHSLFNWFDDLESGKIVRGTDLYSAVSFEDDYGTFETLSDAAKFELIPNNYHLYFELMEWYVSGEELKFSQFDRDDARLVSIGQYQDSLQFSASGAQYDLFTYELSVEGVDEINMDPVTIYPDSSKVVILSDGKMKRLNHANINVDSETIHPYNFYDAHLDIVSGSEFKGSGVFDYKHSEDSIQNISFSKLFKSGDVVFGSAYLNEADNFRLDPYFGFRGRVLLNSSRDFLNFDGDTRIQLACGALNRAWIPFKDDVNPEDVFINLNPSIRLTDRQQWHAGVMLTHGPTICYPAFLSRPKRVNDFEIIEVKGFVHFDALERQYIIGSQEKIENSYLPGNFAKYNPETCSLYSEGIINLGTNSEMLNLRGQGWLFSDFNKKTVAGVVDLSFDFLMHKKAAKRIIKSLKKATNYNPIDQSDELHQRMLADMLGLKQLKKYNRKKQKGKRFLPNELKHTFYFPQLRMEWDHKTASFVSIGDLTLSNIIGRKIDKEVSGVLEIRPRSLGDEMNLYIHLSEQDYYFFSYRRGVMGIISSDKEFNKHIVESPRRLSYRKGSNETGSYRYEIGNLRQMQRFLKRMQWGSDSENL
jgi:hypothetical protein